MHALRRFATRYLIADAAPLSSAERWRSSLAALAGMLLIQGVLAVAPVAPAYRHLLAPLGASSVILFALPHSPLGQPWSTAGGLLLSALVGVACGQWITPGWLAIATALAISIWLMAWLRCLHPPGGAMAVLFASLPPSGELGGVLLNIAAALFAALAVNSLVRGRRWPQCATAPLPAVQPEPETEGVTHTDLQYALHEIDAYLDISEEDLVRVYDLATKHALHRHETQTCGDIMQPPPSGLEFATELDTAWQLLRLQPAQALPVLDRAQRVIGLLGADDFLRHIAPQGKAGLADHIRRLLQPSRHTHSDRPEVVGQIMSTDIIVARSDDRVSAIAARLLARPEQGSIPVVDPEGRLAGLLGQSDLLAAYYHHQAAHMAHNAPIIPEPA